VFPRAVHFREEYIVLSQSPLRTFYENPGRKTKQDENKQKGREGGKKKIRRKSDSFPERA
jgi:hypothetical protein